MIEELSLRYSVKDTLVWVFCELFNALVMTFSVWYLGVFIESLIEARYSNLLLELLMCLGLELLSYLTYVLSIYGRYRLKGTNISGLRQVIAGSLLRKGKMDFDSKDTGEYVSFCLKDAKNLETRYLDPIIMSISASFNLIFLFFVIMSLSSTLAVVVFVFSGLALIAPRLLRTHYENVSEDEELANSTYVSDVRNEMDMTNAMANAGISRQAYPVWRQTVEKYERLIYGITKKRDVLDFISDMSYSFLSVSSVVCALFLSIRGIYPIGFLVSVIKYIEWTFNHTDRLVEACCNMMSSGPYVEKVSSVIDNSSSTTSSDQVKASLLTLHEGMFSYTDQVVWRCDELSFSRGCTYCISGDSGVGKSSMGKIIAGMIEGKDVTADMVLENSCVSDNLAQHVAYINQNAFIFSDDVKGNIGFGGELDLSILDCCGICSDGEMNGMPLERPVSNDSLSGGEKQMIELARALIGSKDFIIFDESFVSIGKEKRAEIISKLRNVSDAGFIFISHHISDNSVLDGTVIIEGGKARWL